MLYLFKTIDYISVISKPVFEYFYKQLITWNKKMWLTIHKFGPDQSNYIFLSYLFPKLRERNLAHKIQKETFSSCS